MTNQKAPEGYRDRRGVITEIGPGATEYRVEFDDGILPTMGYLKAGCLEL